jgi:hypothetical protein
MIGLDGVAQRVYAKYKLRTDESVRRRYDKIKDRYVQGLLDIVQRRNYSRFVDFNSRLKVLSELLALRGSIPYDSLTSSSQEAANVLVAAASAVFDNSRGAQDVKEYRPNILIRGLKFGINVGSDIRSLRRDLENRLLYAALKGGGENGPYAGNLRPSYP